MNIYTDNNKDFRIIMASFMKTIYGRATFVISYSLFLMFMIITLMMFFFYKVIDHKYIVILLVLTLISFIIGSAHYYKELRKFSAKKLK